MRKLDLGCGDNKAEGFEGADIAALPGVDHVFDIMQFPWPFEDGTFDELRSSHYVEHIPQAFFTPNPRYPIAKNVTAVAEGPHSVSLFLKFFDECFRILKPGGTFRVLCPHGHSDRAYQDPSHVRYLVEASWDYLDKEWRKANRLEHAAYAISCDFPRALRRVGATGSDAQIKALSLMSDVVPPGFTKCVQDSAVERYWNMVSDFDVALVKAPVKAPKVDEPGQAAKPDQAPKAGDVAAPEVLAASR